MTLLDPAARSDEAFVEWKLVPVQPTKAMLDAAEHKFQTAQYSLAGFNARELAYKALLDAAPPHGIPAARVEPIPGGVAETVKAAYELLDGVSDLAMSPEWNERRALVLDALASGISGQFKQPHWGHVMQAYVDGARDGRDYMEATEADFGRAADAYTKRVFAEVDPAGDLFLNGRAAVSLPSSTPGLDPKGAKRRQYYYRTNECTARDATDPACICWHDEGTGPRANADPSLVEWREVSGLDPIRSRDGEVKGG